VARWSNDAGAIQKDSPMNTPFFNGRRRRGGRPFLQSLRKFLGLNKSASAGIPSGSHLHSPTRQKTEEEKKEFMRRKYAGLMMAHQAWVDDLED